MVQRYRDETSSDPEWRERCIVEYAYLVRHIASRMARRLPSSVMFEELVSAGSLGLIDAVDKFDPDKHVSLKTYAQYRIKGAILDELRSMDAYSRAMRKKIQSIAKAVKAVEDRASQPAADPEVAAELGVSLDDYYAMLADIHGAAILSMDAFIRNRDNDASSMTRFQEGLTQEGDPAEHFDREELKSVLAEAIGRLSKKEQLVVSLYYYEDLTLKEIGEVLSLTESRICQIHTAVLIKLRSRLQQYNDL